MDYRGIQVDGEMVTLADPEACLDLGGIAKGFIADDLIRLLSKGGCTSALVNLGGNVATLGTKPDGSPWTIGIQDPNQARNTTFAQVEAANQSVVTSGIYERCFTQDGVTYHHILDPRTGRPAQSDLLSSSLLTPQSLEGDALATALFLMGKDRALDILNQRPGIHGLLVGKDNTVTLSTDAPFLVLEEAR